MKAFVGLGWSAAHTNTRSCIHHLFAVYSYYWNQSEQNATEETITDAKLLPYSRLDFCCLQQVGKKRSALVRYSVHRMYIYLLCLDDLGSAAAAMSGNAFQYKVQSA